MAKKKPAKKAAKKAPKSAKRKSAKKAASWMTGRIVRKRPSKDGQPVIWIRPDNKGGGDWMADDPPRKNFKVGDRVKFQSAHPNYPGRRIAKPVQKIAPTKTAAKKKAP